MSSRQCTHFNPYACVRCIAYCAYRQASFRARDHELDCPTCAHCRQLLKAFLNPLLFDLSRLSRSRTLAPLTLSRAFLSSTSKWTRLLLRFMNGSYRCIHINPYAASRTAALSSTPQCLSFVSYSPTSRACHTPASRTLVPLTLSPLVFSLVYIHCMYDIASSGLLHLFCCPHLFAELCYASFSA